MDTNRLKRFATEARNILIGGVVQRLAALGFQPDGTTTEKPELMGGGAVFMGEVQTEDFYHQWMSLQAQVQRRSFREVAEEAAYTWFNRLVAIRIMVKNELAPAVLEYESDEVRIPLIVTEARQGRLPQMDEAQRRKLDALLLNDALTDEQFALLIVAYCHSNPLIQKCFGAISDYTELLLPGNILKSDGFIDRLNADDYITDADYRSPELIGWLYQFYISERKDEVFAKKGKFAADEIPAATQIFTPNWIVKYMVQNTVGRIYLDNNPYSDIKEGMEYLVEPAEPTPAGSIYQLDDICDLKVADLACGSGHILNECFDLLYQIYMEEGYNRRQAVEHIFRHNLTGIDIDLRAKQLATFALLMKACQKEKGFADGHCMPRVLVMPTVSRYTWRDLNGHFCCALGLHTDEVISKELEAAFTLMEDADSLGSIMKFDISPRTREFLQEAVGEQAKQQKFADSFKPLIEGFEVILALTEQYAALVMNPPYMGSGKMNDILSHYVNEVYPNSSQDLYATFMEVTNSHCSPKGMVGMIVQNSWLVNSTFYTLRHNLFEEATLQSLLHMGRGNFGNDWGSTSFALRKSKYNHLIQFFKLYERVFYRIEPTHISQLFLKAKENHSFRFLFKDYSSSTFSLNHSDNGRRIYYESYYNRFTRVANEPICYSFDDTIIDIINGGTIIDCFKPATGLQTGDNNKFIRSWYEISFKSLSNKWFPLVNGGDARKWYGNLTDVINWLNDGYDIKNTKSSVIRNPQFYFKEGITWNRITSKGVTLRYLPNGCIFDQAGDSMFKSTSEDFIVALGYLNSVVAKLFFEMLAPTINLTAGTIAKIPYIQNLHLDNTIPTQNISISRLDWDAHETSWDFRQNELIALIGQSDEELTDIEVQTKDVSDTAQGCAVSLQQSCSNAAQPMQQHCNAHAAKDTSIGSGGNVRLSDLVDKYHRKWEALFMQLHANEEELNRQFIDIYGLQDELTPDVPFSEITILQQGEIEIKS